MRYFVVALGRGVTRLHGNNTVVIDDDGDGRLRRVSDAVDEISAMNKSPGGHRNGEHKRRDTSKPEG